MSKFETITDRFQTNQLENNLLAAELQTSLTECESLRLESELQEKRIQELLLEKTRQLVLHRRETDRLVMDHAEEKSKLGEENRLLSFRISVLENRLKAESDKITNDALAWKPASPSNIESPDPALRAEYGLSEKWIEDYVSNQRPFTEGQELSSTDVDSKKELCGQCQTSVTSKLRQVLNDPRKEARFKSGQTGQLGSNSKKQREQLTTFQPGTDKTTQADLLSLEKQISTPLATQNTQKRTDILGNLKSLVFSLPSFGILVVALLLGLIFRFSETGWACRCHWSGA